MKSFTNLKSIDDIMYIVDGNKGGYGLGYKPYYMIGGMAIREIENPHELGYETEIPEIQREFEEEKGEMPDEQEYETLRTVPLDDVLPEFTTERIIYELSSLSDLMTQIKHEGVRDYDKIYLNIIEDYEKIIDEVSKRPEIKNYTDKEIDEILSDYPTYTQKQAEESGKILQEDAQRKTDNLIMALMKAGKKEDARKFLDPVNMAKVNEKLEKLKSDMIDKMREANNIYNDKVIEINRKVLLAKTINDLKNRFDGLKEAKMANKTDPTTKHIKDFIGVNPIMKQIFNMANTEAASELWDYPFDNAADREKLYNKYIDYKKYPFDKFIIKYPTDKEQQDYISKRISSKISGMKGEQAITDRPILLTLIDKDTSKAKSSMMMSAYNQEFIFTLTGLGFDPDFIINNVLKFSNFDIVKKDTVWELKSFFKDSYTKDGGTQTYTNAKFYGGTTVLITPVDGTIENQKKTIIIPKGTKIVLDYKINKLANGRVNFNVHIKYGVDKKIVQLLPHNSYKYYILEFNKDAIQYFDVGNQYNWDTYISPNKEERNLELPNRAFIKLPNAYTQLYANIYDSENTLKDWMTYKNTYPELIKKPPPVLKEEPVKKGKKKGKKKGPKEKDITEKIIKEDDDWMDEEPKKDKKKGKGIIFDSELDDDYYHVFSNKNEIKELMQKTIPKIKEAIKKYITPPKVNKKIYIVSLKYKPDDNNKKLIVNCSQANITPDLNLSTGPNDDSFSIVYTKDDIDNIGFDKSHIIKIIDSMKKNKLDLTKQFININDIQGNINKIMKSKLRPYTDKEKEDIKYWEDKQEENEENMKIFDKTKVYKGVKIPIKKQNDIMNTLLSNRTNYIMYLRGVKAKPQIDLWIKEIKQARKDGAITKEDATKYIYGTERSLASDFSIARPDIYPKYETSNQVSELKPKAVKATKPKAEPEPKPKPKPKPKAEKPKNIMKGRTDMIGNKITTELNIKKGLQPKVKRALKKSVIAELDNKMCGKGLRGRTISLSSSDSD
jgi:hypothetical protein